METNQYLRYSEAFKLEVIQEIEAGMNLTQVGKRYGVSTCGVRRWLAKYGKNHLLSKVVRVETLDEKDRMKELEKEKQRLESALAQTQLKVIALEEMIRLAEVTYKVDIKKNSGLQH